MRSIYAQYCTEAMVMRRARASTKSRGPTKQIRVTLYWPGYARNISSERRTPGGRRGNMKPGLPLVLLGVVVCVSLPTATAPWSQDWTQQLSAPVFSITQDMDVMVP